MRMVRVPAAVTATGVAKESAVGDGMEPQLSMMQLAVDIASPPIEQGSQGDRDTEAASGTRPRTALRYDQLCQVRGTIRIGAREMQLNALAPLQFG